MGQTFGEMQTELYARGFDFLEDDATGVTRAKRWLNEAYKELCDLADWPFTAATTTQAPPYTFTNLKNIETVYDTVTDLTLYGATRQNLTWWFGDLTQTGNAQYWYLDGEVLRVYPVSTNSLSIRYQSVPADLTLDANEPVVPDRFRYLIVDGAVIKGYKDTHNFEHLAALRNEYMAGVDAMFYSVLGRGAEQYVLQSSSQDF